MHLYFAEYLPRINSIALSVQLDPQYRISNLSILSETQAILYYYDKNHGNKAASPLQLTLTLPAKLSSKAVNTSVQVEKPDINIASFRLSGALCANCSDDTEQRLSASSFFDHPDYLIPWPASVLENNAKSTNNDTNGFDIRCRYCNNLLVAPNMISNWKALPSENWAELMDYWHCHKPADGSSSFNRSYALSGFIPYKGTSFVGNSYFLFTKEDCLSDAMVEMSVTENHTNNRAILCSSCKKPVGHARPDGITYDVKKWSVVLPPRAPVTNLAPLPSSYPLHIFVYTIFEQLISAHATYTFSLFDESSRSEYMVLWILNPDVWYAMNDGVDSDQVVRRGFKVVFAFDKDARDSLRETKNDVEDVLLPQVLLEALKVHLTKNQHYVPDSKKKYGQWDLSVLERL